MQVLIITGPPYSGKGTQCELLKATTGFRHVSTGEKIRKEKQNKTPIGSTMTVYEKNGGLVPDNIMQDLVSQIIDENLEEKGIILDGYPRTKSQVDTIISLLKDKNLSINTIINIDVPKNELLIRAKKRAANSDREDDKNPETHLKRISVFEEETRPAIAYMKNKLDVIDINGLDTIENISTKINEALKNRQ